MTEQSVVVGVFKDEAQARSAMDTLLDAQFNNHQIRIAVPGGGLVTHSICDELMNMGVSEELANHYAHEFEAGCSIVSVRHEGRYWEAVNILYNGRIHRYLNLKRSDTPASYSNGWIEQKENSHSSSLSVAAEGPQSQTLEETSTITMPVWQKLLMDAGIDRLLDQLL